jgi:hypothetical protein
MRKPFLTTIVLVAVTCPLVPAQDWPTFGWDVSRSSAPNVATGLRPDGIGSLSRQQALLDGTVDGSAIYLRGATIAGSPHDAFFVTTTYGKTLAIDADSGEVLWEYTPASYESLKLEQPDRRGRPNCPSRGKCELAPDERSPEHLARAKIGASRSRSTPCGERRRVTIFVDARGLL